MERCVSAVSQCEETEEGLRPPETTLSGEHDVQTEAQSLEELRKDIPLMMESSGSESESETGSGNAFDSGVSSKSDMSKEENIFFKRRQRMSAQSGDSYDSDWSEGTFPPLRVLLRPIGSSCVSVLGDRSERQRRHFPQIRRRSKRMWELSVAVWRHCGGTSQEVPAGLGCKPLLVSWRNMDI